MFFSQNSYLCGNSEEKRVGGFSIQHAQKIYANMESVVNKADKITANTGKSTFNFH